MNIEKKYQRHHNRIEKRWRKLKRKCDCCPDCFETAVGLNEILGRRTKRFFVECENCHWCGKSMPTIRLAISSWNRQRCPSEKLYNKELL